MSETHTRNTKLQSNKLKKMARSCQWREFSQKNHKKLQDKTIDFPIFISDDESESYTGKKIQSVEDDNFPISDGEKIKQCQCDCHKEEDIGKFQNWWNKQSEKVKQLKQLIVKLKDTHKNIKTSIEIQLQNQKEIMNLFSKRVIKFLNQTIHTIQKQSENKYLNILNSIHQYNSLLKKKINRIEQELKDYKNGYQIRNKKQSSFLRASHPQNKYRLRVPKQESVSSLKMFENEESELALEQIETLQSKINSFKEQVQNRYSNIE